MTLLISVGIIILGAFVAGARDLSFDYYSYTVVLVSNITTAVYLACISSLGISISLYLFSIRCLFLSFLDEFFDIS